MTTRDLPTLLFLAVALLLGWRGCDVSGDLAVAEAARATAEAAHVRAVDSLEALTAAREQAQRADSLEHARMMDSVAVSRLRAAEATQRASEAIERAEGAQARAHATAETLAETLDSVQTVLFADHLAEDDSVVSALTARAEAAEDRTLAVEMENAALWRRMETADDLIASLSAERDGERNRADAAESVADALRSENRSLRAQGWLWKGAAVVGVVVAATR